MAEESPLSPNSHKRRITEMVTPNDHPTLNLSLLPPSEVETSSLEFLGISETQEIHCFPQQSPKKPKFEGSNSGDILEEISNLDDGKPEFQEKGSLISKKEVKFDENNEVSEVGFEEKEVGFKQNDENASEIGEKIDVSESNELGFEEKSENLDGVLKKLLKKEDLTESSLKFEVIDGTALVDVSLIGEKKNRRRGNNNNNKKKMKSNSRNNGVNLVNEGKKKCVYSRKELEVLRYVNVKGQRKFWQEVYDGFSAIVKKDYDDVGSFRHQRNGGTNSEYNGGKKSFNDGGIMGVCSNGAYFNNRGILGVAAARGRCNNTNIFVYKRKRILNAKA